MGSEKLIRFFLNAFPSDTDQADALQYQIIFSRNSIPDIFHSSRQLKNFRYWILFFNINPCNICAEMKFEFFQKILFFH